MNAVEQIEELANTDANKERIQELQNMMHNGSQIELVKEGRALIGQGLMSKICKKNVKERLVLLFNDVFVYCHPGKELKNPVQIYLKDMTVKDLPDCDIHKHKIEIRSPQKSFLLVANDAHEKDKWLVYLQRMIQNEKEHNNSCTASEQEMAPIMVPDDETQNCPICSRSFNITVRRHHCRKCGSLACKKCIASKGYVLNTGNDKKQKVCINCEKSLVK